MPTAAIATTVESVSGPFVIARHEVAGSQRPVKLEPGPGMTDDLETLLRKRPKQKGMELRIERRPDGRWDVGFWRRGERRNELIRGYRRFWNGSDDVARLGAEGQTRDEALANFVDLLNLLEGPTR
jgi:hypothetical protein